MERSLIGILGASGKVGQLVCDYLVRNTGYGYYEEGISEVATEK